MLIVLMFLSLIDSVLASQSNLIDSLQFIIISIGFFKRKNPLFKINTFLSFNDSINSPSNTTIHECKVVLL